MLDQLELGSIPVMPARKARQSHSQSRFPGRISPSGCPHAGNFPQMGTDQRLYVTTDWRQRTR